MADYIPRNDREFEVWFRNFIVRAEEFSAEMGLTQNDITQMQTYLAQLAAAIENAETLRQASIAATREKDTIRDTVEDYMRGIVDDVQGRRTMTDTARAAVRITIPTSDRVRRSPAAPENLTGQLDIDDNAVLSWDNNGNTQRTIYNVWMIVGESGEPQMVGAVTRRSFVHVNPPQDKLLTYYVTATRGDETSPASNRVILRT